MSIVAWNRKDVSFQPASTKAIPTLHSCLISSNQHDEETMHPTKQDITHIQDWKNRYYLHWSYFLTCRMPRCKTMKSEGLTKEWTRATWRVTCCQCIIRGIKILWTNFTLISRATYQHESNDDHLLKPNLVSHGLLGILKVPMPVGERHLQHCTTLV